MTPRRILMTVDAVGGVWQYAADLSAALKLVGVKTILALLGPAPSAAQRSEMGLDITLIDTGLPLDWLAPSAAAVEAAGTEIAVLAEHHDVDLVHLNQPALAASACFAMPVVTTIHSCVGTWWQAVHGGVGPASFAWQTELVTRGLLQSDAVAAPSRAFAEAVKRTHALRNLPNVVPNGRRSLTTHQDTLDETIFTAGRLWDQGKNVAMLDRVAARLPHPFRAAGAVRGPHGESIALHHVELLGSLDEAMMTICLAARPIFVSAARYEPFGLSVLEAASAGCPLVLSDIPTFREHWDEVALFADPSDEDGFIRKIEALFADPGQRMIQGERARTRAAHFTPSRMAAAMSAIYAQVLVNRSVAVRTVAA